MLISNFCSIQPFRLFKKLIFALLFKSSGCSDLLAQASRLFGRMTRFSSAQLVKLLDCYPMFKSSNCMVFNAFYLITQNFICNREGKENNIIVISLPPHTSHRLHPLDRTVYRSLKHQYSRECYLWHLWRIIMAQTFLCMMSWSYSEKLFRYRYTWKRYKWDIFIQSWNFQWWRFQAGRSKRYPWWCYSYK